MPAVANQQGGVPNGTGSGAKQPTQQSQGAGAQKIVQHVSHPLATVGQRFWALLIDLIIVTVVSSILALLLSIAALRLVSLELLSSIVLGLSILYFILFESMDGQTIGKKIMHIKVVSEDSMKKPDLIAVIIRNVLRLIDSFPPNFYIVGFILVILTDKHQRLGDILAKTVVVKEEERIS